MTTPVRWAIPRESESHPPRLRDALYAIVVGSIVGSIVYVWLTIDHFGGLESLLEAAPDDLPVSPMLWAMAVTGGVELIWVGLVLMGRGRSISEYLGLSLEPEDMILGLALYVAVLVGSILVLSVLVPELGVETDGYESQFPSALAESSELQIVAFIALVGLLVPFVEEVLFRGVILRALEPTRGSGLAVLGSSVFFGLAHVATLTEADVPQVAFATTTGLILGAFVVYTGRLTPAVIAHSINNVIAALVLTSV